MLTLVPFALDGVRGCRESDKVPCWQGTVNNSARQDWGRLARDHLERGNHEQRAGYDQAHKHTAAWRSINVSENAARDVS